MFTFLELQSHVIFENIEYQKATQIDQTRVNDDNFISPQYVTFDSNKTQQQNTKE